MIVRCCNEELIDLPCLVNLLLSLINSKKDNSKYCIDSISELMVIYPEYFIKTYSIQNPCHPFIEILRNSNQLNTNLHECIYQQIVFIFTFSELNIKQVVSILKPVLIEIFLDSSFYKHLVVKILIDKINSSRNFPDELFFEFYDLLELYIACLTNKDFEKPFFKQSLNQILILVINNNGDNLNEKINLYSLVNLLIKVDHYCDIDLKNEWEILKALIKSVSILINYNIKISITLKN
jgi:hypothetical protein